MAGLIPSNKKSTRLINTGLEEFYNMVDDFFNDSIQSGKNLLGSSFKIDVQDNNKEYIIEAELPGVKKEEISLDINEEKLTIAVNHEENVEEEKKNYVHKERKTSSMSRKIYLADSMSEGITAKLDNGVLKIIVPKQEKLENNTRIEIE